MMTCSVDKQSTICVKGCHYSVPDRLVGQTQIREAKTDRTLRNLEVKFERDELGYVGFEKEEAEMLFNHLFTLHVAISFLNHEYV